MDARLLRLTLHTSDCCKIVKRCAYSYSPLLPTISYALTYVRFDRDDMAPFISIATSLLLPSLLANALAREARTNADIDVHSCSIPKLDTLSLSDFKIHYKGRLPVIFRRSLNAPHLVELTSQPSFISHFGSHSVVLASSNSFSHTKILSSVADYVRDFVVRQQSPDDLANETFYLFGDTLGEEWHGITKAYPMPMDASEDEGLVAWGAGGVFSGVSFHTHGAAWGETLWGRKRWYLAHPHRKPVFNGNASQLQWVLQQRADANIDSLRDAEANIDSLRDGIFAWEDSSSRSGRGSSGSSSGNRTDPQSDSSGRSGGTLQLESDGSSGSTNSQSGVLSSASIPSSAAVGPHDSGLVRPTSNFNVEASGSTDGGFDGSIGGALYYSHETAALEDRVLGCTCEPGDVIYVPPMWWHATLNLDPWTFFVSTFTQERGDD